MAASTACYFCYLLPRLAPWGGFWSVKGCLVAADMLSEALAVLLREPSVEARELLLLFPAVEEVPSPVPRENMEDVERP